MVLAIVFRMLRKIWSLVWISIFSNVRPKFRFWSKFRFTEISNFWPFFDFAVVFNILILIKVSIVCQTFDFFYCLLFVKNKKTLSKFRCVAEIIVMTKKGILLAIGILEIVNEIRSFSLWTDSTRLILETKIETCV